MTRNIEEGILENVCLTLEKINGWRNKSYSEDDPIDKYISLFISYNIFYNLYAITEKSENIDGEWITIKRKDFDEAIHKRDKKKVTKPIDLVNVDVLYQHVKNDDLEGYLYIISRFREEYWGSQEIKRSLRRNFRDPNKKKETRAIPKRKKSWDK